MSDLIASELLERGGGVEGGARVAGEGEVLVESVGGGVEDWNRVDCSVGEGLGVGCWESKPESPDDLLICSCRKYNSSSKYAHGQWTSVAPQREQYIGRHIFKSYKYFYRTSLVL